MFDIMSRAQNAISVYNDALKETSANIANMNVPGAKALDYSFQSIYERLISQGSASSNNQGGTNPIQLGQGVSLASTSIDFSAGETITGTSLDLAISGAGLFILSPDGGSSYNYTRAGGFQIDAFGNLTSNNMQVYGLNNSGALVPITGLTGPDMTLYSWTAAGKLQYNGNDTGYSIALTYFANPSGLVQAQGTTFKETMASGSAATAQTAGGAVGSLLPGQIEQSNIVYLTETINALELQRAMSGNLSMLKMASDLISSFIQKLG